MEQSLIFLFMLFLNDYDFEQKKWSYTCWLVILYQGKEEKKRGNVCSKVINWF